MYQLTAIAAQKNFEAVGPHYQIFQFEKSENPENILVVYTKLDKDCRFVLEPDNLARPIFGFYWLMDGQNYKPVHALIQSGIAERLQIMIPENFSKKRDFFSVQVRDLIQVDPALGDALVHVKAVRTLKDCDLKVTFHLESGLPKTISEDKNNSAKLVLEKIYAESEKTIIPPFRKVVSLRFEGSNEKTGDPEQRVYQTDKSR